MSNLKTGVPWSSRATASPSIKQERQGSPATASAHHRNILGGLIHRELRLEIFFAAR
jgi:hypothetical protein